MQQIDRRVGLALALLAAAVLWSARSFPSVPGQKLGAGFLPMLVGVGLLCCGLALMWRSRGVVADADARLPERLPEQSAGAFATIAVIALYVLAADRVGFLIVAPIGLVIAFKALRVGWQPSLLWAVGGTLVVHFAFYKLLRVPLPWGVLRPFY